MTNETDQFFYLTPDDFTALIAGKLSKTDWQIYIHLRLFENTEDKPSVQKMIEICEYTPKTFYKSLKKLQATNLIPTWAENSFLTTKGAN